MPTPIDTHREIPNWRIGPEDQYPADGGFVRDVARGADANMNGKTSLYELWQGDVPADQSFPENHVHEGIVAAQNRSVIGDGFRYLGGKLKVAAHTLLVNAQAAIVGPTTVSGAEANLLLDRYRPPQA